MLRAKDLRCNYLVDPIGIGDREPFLTWALADLPTGGVQQACQVLVASDPRLLVSGHADYWDSGRVETTRCQLRYTGNPLPSCAQCWWSVRVWSDLGEASMLTPPARFELALRPEEWNATWLGFSPGWAGQALMLRHTFSVESTVERARAYVTSIGWHQLRLNGVAVDARVLEPAPTVVTRRLVCSTYAIEKQLREGTNAVGLLLAGGWYGTPQVRVQIHLSYANGRHEVICSGASSGQSSRPWMIAPAPIVASSPYDGEVRDGRLEIPGWDLPEYAGMPPHALPGDELDPWAILFGVPGARQRKWATPVAADAPTALAFAAAIPPAMVTEEVRAVTITQPRPQIWVVDAGVNGAGWVRLRVSGAPRGRRVVLRFAEILREDGTVNQDNLRAARATDIYVCGGASVEAFEPTFTAHGFRFVQVEGLAQAPAPQDVLVRYIRTPLALRGRFTGEPLLERIFAMVARTETSNTLGMLTDCPQRDERHTWLNDLTDRLDTTAYVLDAAPLLAKVLEDIADAQRADGAIPDTVPYRWGFEVADPVCLAPLLLPRLLLRHWGEERMLERAYPVARGWIHYLESQCEGGILRLTRWGDWSEPSGDGTLRAEARSQRTPGPLVSTACLAWGLRALADLAEAAGDESEARRARESAVGVAAAFHRVFFDPATGGYGTGSQGSLACALGFGVVPPERIGHVASLLASEVEHTGHLTTGNIATKFVLEALSDHGRHDLALRLARREDYPSWGYMLRSGATTLWERWEEATSGGMNSHNHGMLGAIGSWLITRHAGLTVAQDAIGSDRWLVTLPAVTEDAEAGAELDSPRGLAAVHWRRSDGHLVTTITIPPGTRALIHLPLPAHNVEGDAPVQPTENGHFEASVGGGTWSFRGVLPV